MVREQSSYARHSRRRPAPVGGVASAYTRSKFSHGAQYPRSAEPLVRHRVPVLFHSPFDPNADVGMFDVHVVRRSGRGGAASGRSAACRACVACKPGLHKAFPAMPARGDVAHWRGTDRSRAGQHGALRCARRACAARSHPCFPPDRDSTPPPRRMVTKQFFSGPPVRQGSLGWPGQASIFRPFSTHQDPDARTCEVRSRRRHGTR